VTEESRELERHAVCSSQRWLVGLSTQTDTLLTPPDERLCTISGASSGSPKKARPTHSHPTNRWRWRRFGAGPQGASFEGGESERIQRRQEQEKKVYARGARESGGCRRHSVS